MTGWGGHYEGNRMWQVLRNEGNRMWQGGIWKVMGCDGDITKVTVCGSVHDESNGMIREVLQR